MIERFTEEEFKNAKSKDKLALECEQCGKVFYAERKIIKYERTHKTGRLKYCSHECHNKKQNTSIQVNCENCGKEISVVKSTFENSKTKHFFCDHSCAASYNNKQKKLSEDTRKKISESLHKFYESKEKLIRELKPIGKKYDSKNRFREHTCSVCGRSYYTHEDGASRTMCSHECREKFRNNRKKYLSEETILKLRNAGLKSSQTQSENRRSKNEIYFYDLCKEHFKNVKHNIPLFNGWDADIIIEDIKYAILWNGKWHYEKIKEGHSVKQVQNRDQIKVNEITKCGYKPYIIKDMGKYNPKFVEKEFDNFINYIAEE